MKIINEEIIKLILARKYVEVGALRKAVEECEDTKVRIENYLVDLKLLKEENRAMVMAEYAKMSYLDIEGVEYNDKVVKICPQAFIDKYKIIPINAYDKDGKPAIVDTEHPDITGKIKYLVAISDPFDDRQINIVTSLFGTNVDIVVGSPAKILKLSSSVFSKASMNEAITQYSSEENLTIVDSSVDELEGADILSAPAVKLADSILKEGIAAGASDIHIEPYETIVRVRYRVDGALYESATFSTTLFPAVSTRFKILSGMNIAERRIPQDGRIKQNLNGVDYDFRVSSLPTVYGEKIVIRVLDTKAFAFTRDKLGFLPEENSKIDELIHKPYGIILLTGPTGCGKSTTLYSFIKEVNNDSVNVITVEDPVEYTMIGVNQVQVNAKAGMTFASALRSILRQDPNVIMIGEIRDEETAQIAIRSAITGHLVFSTLHTNDAPGAVARLIDMGVEPYFISDALSGVIAQRLVRRLCPACKLRVKTNEHQMKMLGITKPIEIYEPVGCPACHGSGYKGRVGIHEVLMIDEEVREMIMAHASTEAMKERAIEKGMITLVECCRRAVIRGDSSIAELREIMFKKD